MRPKLNSKQQALHDKALVRSRAYKQCEWPIIEVLQEVEKTELNLKFKCSVFVYAVQFLEIDETLAYPMIKAASLARKIPRLAQSLQQQRLTVVKANRIFSVLTEHNADELIAFAETHSANEINQEVANMRRRAGLPPKLSNIKVSIETKAMLKRARSILGGKIDEDSALQKVLAEFIEKHDPVAKAQRAMDRKARKHSANANGHMESPSHVSDEDKSSRSNTTDSPSAGKASTVTKVSVRTENPKRQPRTADQTHQVFARDGGQCTFIDVQGRRCSNDRFLHIHHIHPVSLGGSNDPENLTTLCSLHHDLVHQLALPLDYQVTWLR